MDDVRRRYLGQIRGGRLSPALAAAFAAVPREVFVADGFHRDGRRVMPDDPDYLAAVYSDDALVTKMTAGVPVSSSSQPSLMAAMIEALEVRPGMRILEIGAGTGYNAALLVSLGAVVTTVDVQDDVAARARSALARAGIEGVRVEAADGYTGGPFERYDGIIVTVGVAGISPHWLDRLEPGGRLIVPVAHGGIHPVLDIRRVRDAGPGGSVRPGTETQAGPLSASVVCPAGFMSAAGPLNIRHPRSHPPVAAGLKDLAEVSPPCWQPPLDADAYRGLWFAAAAWHQSVSYAPVPGGEQSCLAVLDDSGTAGAVVLADGAILASGPESQRCAAVGTALSDRWWSLGRPPVTAWQIGFTLTGDPAAPIWAPARWTLTPPAAVGG